MTNFSTRLAPSQRPKLAPEAATASELRADVVERAFIARVPSGHRAEEEYIAREQEDRQVHYALFQKAEAARHAKLDDERLQAANHRELTSKRQGALTRFFSALASRLVT